MSEHQYPPDFFDLVIIDECHRSGFGTWFEILQHFKDAVHLGMTATPKRDDNIDTYAYFGQPVYSYSLGEGISDGFLAPYQIFRFFTNIDKEGLHLSEALFQGAQIYVPEESNLKELYTLEDFEREIVVPDRTKVICEHLAGLLKTFNPRERTIVYCVSSDHAAQVAKELQNHFAYLGYPNYAVRIVAEEPGHEKLYEDFQLSEKITPVVATTVDLLTTGVDIPSAKNIVLLKPIASKVFFKQIIGRGSRLDPASNKYFFRIIDYVNATRLLDAWDYPPTAEPPKVPGGPFDLSLLGKVIEHGTDAPVTNAKVIAQIGPNLQRSARTDKRGAFTLASLPHSPITLYISKGGFRSREFTITPRPEAPPLVIELKREVKKVEKAIIHNVEVHIEQETLLIYAPDGKSLTEAEYKEYSRRGIVKRVAKLDDLRLIWLDDDRRYSFLKELEGESIYPELLALLLKRPDADLFDILAHVAFDAPILTRDERAQRVLNLHQSFLQAFGGRAREVLLALLEKYRIGGIGELRPEVFRVPPFDRMGYVQGVIQRFETSERLKLALSGLRERIYGGE